MKMTGAFNALHRRRGTLWEGRFKSVLVEGDEALRAVAAYIDLNPVRAGLVDNPEDYRWCSYAAAVAGVKGARSGLASAVTGKAGSPWRIVSAEYRKLLFGYGLEKVGARRRRGGSERKPVSAPSGSSRFGRRAGGCRWRRRCAAGYGISLTARC